jgi:hypothetical protein
MPEQNDMRFSRVLLVISLAATAVMILGYVATQYGPPSAGAPASFAH